MQLRQAKQKAEEAQQAQEANGENGEGWLLPEAGERRNGRAAANSVLEPPAPGKGVWEKARGGVRCVAVKVSGSPL
eukprot:Skav205060  [mRNA]  locus=scaffold142:268987:270003:+ [translate_table: standard]